MQLTAKLVATLVKRPGRYHDGHGLILVVVNPNNASWQLRYQRNGRERWFGLGPLHTVTLKDARERARAARLQLLDGIDPIDVRRAERAKATQVVTFLGLRRSRTPLTGLSFEVYWPRFGGAFFVSCERDRYTNGRPLGCASIRAAVG
jgi:hypothetical protein